MWYWVCTLLTPSLDLMIRCRRLILRSFRAALCQVFDSIYMDIPMSRVKFNVNGEYAYIQNFKVLQSKQSQPTRLRCPRRDLDR